MTEERPVRFFSGGGGVSPGSVSPELQSAYFTTNFFCITAYFTKLESPIQFLCSALGEVDLGLLAI
jgi:hypothetical protein